MGTPFLSISLMMNCQVGKFTILECCRDPHSWVQTGYHVFCAFFVFGPLELTILTPMYVALHFSIWSYVPIWKSSSHLPCNLVPTIYAIFLASGQYQRLTPIQCRSHQYQISKKLPIQGLVCQPKSVIGGNIPKGHLDRTTH